ncbi:MAG: TRAP transporter small permease [Roseibacillus sp.]
MKVFAQIQKFLSQALGVICAVVFAVLVIDVLFAVVMRHFFEQPAWTEELARLLLVWLAILGGVLAYAADRHLGVDVLVARFDSTTRRRAVMVGHLIILGFSVSVLLVGGWQLFSERYASGQMMASLGIRRAWFYFVLPVGGFLISFLAVEKFLEGFIKTEEANEKEVVS